MGVKLEDVLSRGLYFKNDTEFGEIATDVVVSSVGAQKKDEDKVYTYSEAINLTGNGWYNIGLLFTLALAMQSMAMDMFGFSIVVSAGACDLQLDHSEQSILLSMPLLGSILSAYPWGYISDTQGRKKSLSISLWGSFILASLTAFSPDWITLAVLKFFASSLSSGTQSMAFTLLGESCGARTNGPYLIIMTSALMIGLGVFYAHGYVVLGLHFAFDLGFIVFQPWRLLVLTLAMSLGISAILVAYFYESPKFLVNIGKTEEAINILKKIKERNGQEGIYPVKKIILAESTTLLRRKDLSLMESLWQQTLPLFKPPHLKDTLLLFYLTAVVYSVNNGFFMWIPTITNSFFNNELTSDKNVTGSFCDLMSLQPVKANHDCSSIVNLESLITGIVQGVAFIIINYGVSKFAHRKKIVLVYVFIFCAASSLAMLFVTNKIFTIILFFGVLLSCLGVGLIFAYFVELFPTSYRGMISCLGIMVARCSAVAGVNIVGAYIFTQCSSSLYIWSAYILSGALVSLLLPRDKKMTN